MLSLYELGLAIGSFFLRLVPGGSQTATRTLTVDLGDADRTLTFTGDATLPQQQVYQGEWKYGTSTTMADPGSGNLRMNAATAAATTQIAISRTTNQGIDRHNLLAALTTGDPLQVQDEDTSTSWARFGLTGVPTDNGSWFLVSVAYASGSGTMPSNNERLLVSVYGGGGGGGGVSSIADTSTIDLTLAAGVLSGVTRQQMSITSDASGLKLQNDAATPGASRVYGTDAGGTKGWFAGMPAGGTAGQALVKNSGTDYDTAWVSTGAATSVTDTATIDLTLSAGVLSGVTRQQMSLTSDASGLKLQNDAASPGNLQTYGVDGTGAKGWALRPGTLLGHSYVGTSESTSAAPWVELTTTQSFTVNMPAAGKVLIGVSANASNNTANGNCSIGAFVGASGLGKTMSHATANGNLCIAGFAELDLPSGTSTFTMKFGSSPGTTSFNTRQMAVWSL